MKAIILAAGLGTRLKPWTEHHPKALVPIGGTPMLERVIIKLKEQGFTNIVINIHHFGEQIIDFINRNDFGVSIKISDERGCLLDTGGGILHARQLLTVDNEPFLIHNVDILSNANLRDLMQAHQSHSADATLLVSQRQSSRRLIFTDKMQLKGWHNLSTDQLKPQGLELTKSDIELAFSGIHVMSSNCLDKMIEDEFPESFPIMDFYLSQTTSIDIYGYVNNNLQILDIGKPESLRQADMFTNY